MIIIFIIAFVLLLIDQISKMLAFGFEPSNVTVIPHILKFRLTFNTGAAFSIFDNNTLFLALISLVMSIFITYYIIKNDFKNNKFLAIVLAMILAGAFGNLIDRFLTVFNVIDGVVDFIDLYLFGWHFPGTFNMADVYLTIGIILLAIYIVFLSDKKKIEGEERTHERTKDNK